MEKVSDLIQTSMDAQSPITVLVVFPRPEFLTGPPALGHIKSVALMRLEDATVWSLILDKAAWTNERLQATAETLARVSKQAFTRNSIESLLRNDLGIRSLSMALPPAVRRDVSQPAPYGRRRGAQ